MQDWLSGVNEGLGNEIFKTSKYGRTRRMTEEVVQTEILDDSELKEQWLYRGRAGAGL